MYFPTRKSTGTPARDLGFGREVAFCFGSALLGNFALRHVADTWGGVVQEGVCGACDGRCVCPVVVRHREVPGWRFAYVRPLSAVTRRSGRGFGVNAAFIRPRKEWMIILRPRNKESMVGRSREGAQFLAEVAGRSLSALLVRSLPCAMSGEREGILSR